MGWGQRIAKLLSLIVKDIDEVNGTTVARANCSLHQNGKGEAVTMYKHCPGSSVLRTLRIATSLPHVIVPILLIIPSDEMRSVTVMEQHKMCVCSHMLSF